MVFTEDDKAFLKLIHISWEDRTKENVILSALTKCRSIVVSRTLADQIIKQYGELNFDTYAAYRTGVQRP